MSPEALEYGKDHALLFHGFARFAIEHAHQNQIDRLYFFTREGVFFKRIHDQIFESAKCTCPKIHSVLLEASRQSTFGATIDFNHSDPFARLWNLYPRMSPSAFMKSLNLECGELIAAFNKAGLPLNDPVESPWNNPSFRALVEETRVFSRIKSKLEENRNLVREYFSNAFGGSTRVGIVEIGWQGSIQDNLALLFPEKEFLGFYMGLAVSKNRIPSNSKKIAFGPDRNKSGEQLGLLDAVNVLEFLTLTRGGSTTGYNRQSSGVVQAIRNANPFEDEKIGAFSECFQKGVVQAGREQGYIEQLFGPSLGDIRKLAIEDWQSILDKPFSPLVQAYFAFKSNEEFGLGEFRDQSQTPSWQTLLSAPFKKQARDSLIRYLTYSQWAVGMLHRNDMPPLKRMVFFCYMRLAIVAKRFKHDRLHQLNVH